MLHYFLVFWAGLAAEQEAGLTTGWEWAGLMAGHQWAGLMAGHGWAGLMVSQFGLERVDY